MARLQLSPSIVMAQLPKLTNLGQSVIEILVAIGISAIVLPAIYLGLLSSRQGKYQNQQYTLANHLLSQTIEATKIVREAGWTSFALNGTYYPAVSGNSWVLLPGTEVVGEFTRSLVIADVFRDSSGNITPSGGVVDPSTKLVTTTISWTAPNPSSISDVSYFTRYLDNLAHIQTTEANFNTGTLANTSVTNTAGGEFQLANNTKAKWCSPEFSPATIDLPDGPPVAVAALANLSTDEPNAAFVATAPSATNSAKMSYIRVSANTDPPVSTLGGLFTLDPALYSQPGYVPVGIGLDNNFRSNDVKHYTSAAGNTYAIVSTTKTDREVIAILTDDGNPSNDNDTSGEYADPVNKIFKYWTYFNTRIYNTAAGLNTGFTNPTANSANSGGDGDGFASNPTRGYSDNSSFAIDTNSGNNTGTSCTGADKDKHRYYNYGFSIPGGATINGIEVRLDARVDNQTGSPFMCVQLSWDSGTTWTATQSTPTLNTSEGTYLLGGPADTWGRTWSTSDLSNPNFRLRIINVSSNTSRDFSLDWAAVNVYFSSGASATNDQAPFDYGGSTLTILGDRGYVASGGYLYVFDLSNIDSKHTGSELDQIGCRIQLDGYDCLPGSGTDRKYSAAETGTSWSDTTSPAHSDCSDGGNIELYATNDIYGIQSGGRNYIFSAVGAGTNPEFNIVDATDIPGPATSPSINNVSCGRITGGNSGWKRTGSYDFNSNSGTEEAANSVYARADGNRAYISSNGTADSMQFYILNTQDKSSPAFLSGTSVTGPASGYYLGTGANAEMYPRRSLTVLNGGRVVLVGKDGVPNGNDAFEYQVLNSENESTLNYCGGLNFDQGFNDLTAVSEADGDNFVYMVANTTLNELKIIQGGPDGTYMDSGTYESAAFDPGYQIAFNRFFTTAVIPGGTTVQFQVAVADQVDGSCSGATYNFVGPDGTSGTFFTPSGGQIPLDDDGSGYENPARCLKVKAYLSSTDFDITPVVNDITVNYSP